MVSLAQFSVFIFYSPLNAVFNLLETKEESSQTFKPQNQLMTWVSITLGRDSCLGPGKKSRLSAPPALMARELFINKTALPSKLRFLTTKLESDI
jgi:hypothetical protein